MSRKFVKVMTVAVLVITLLSVLYIMLHGLGLNDELDFGAGAYYYTDIPDYQKYINDDAYRTGVPYWVHAVLFLCWGWLMYRLWLLVDGRKNGKNDGK